MLITEYLLCCCKQKKPSSQSQACKTMASNEDPTVEDAYMEGKKMMARGDKHLGVLTPGAPEDIRFRSFFGAGVETVLDAWNRMKDLGLLPLAPTLLFVHYLWALAFMCLYPKNEAALCAICGGADPKTVRNKTWPFIYAIKELGLYVVSLMCVAIFIVCVGYCCLIVYYLCLIYRLN